MQRGSHTTSWLDIQDIIGDKKLWPKYVLLKFWCSRINYRDRVVIASFAYANGCDYRSLNECLSNINRNYTGVKGNKIKELFHYWAHPIHGFARRAKRTAYNIINKQVEDLNGEHVSFRYNTLVIPYFTIADRGRGLSDDSVDLSTICD